MTKEELETRKEKAISLLNAHTDKYRVFYSNIANISDITEEELTELKRKRELLSLESDVIHTQINMLNELIYHVDNETASEK